MGVGFRVYPGIFLAVKGIRLESLGAAFWGL